MPHLMQNSSGFTYTISLVSQPHIYFSESSINHSRVEAVNAINSSLQTWKSMSILSKIFSSEKPVIIDIFVILGVNPMFRQNSQALLIERTSTDNLESFRFTFINSPINWPVAGKSYQKPFGSICESQKCSSFCIFQS